MKKTILTGRSINKNIRETAKQYNAKSVFGFSYIKSPLYGGRLTYEVNVIPKDTIDDLKLSGVGFDLALSNHYFNEDLYQQTIPVLEEHHEIGNSVIITNNKFALRVRSDFPKYRIKASCIRNPRTIESVYRTLEIFDELALQTNAIKNKTFIRSIPPELRDRVILFGNSGCLFNCAKPICYPSISRQFAGISIDYQCTNKDNQKHFENFYWFNYEDSELFDGFNNIKLVLPQPHHKIIHLDVDKDL